jgi:hypothetical protein
MSQIDSQLVQSAIPVQFAVRDSVLREFGPTEIDASIEPPPKSIVIITTTSLILTPNCRCDEGG